jgi:hypothetical protein
MVMPVLFQTLEDSLQSVFGSMSLVALLIILAFIIGFMFVGVDFRYAIMFSSPLAPAFVAIGWFPTWVAIVFWILVIMFGGYILWFRNIINGGG